MGRPGSASIKSREGMKPMTKRVAVFAGSFDPLTNGHLDLIERASRLFDELIVLIAVNTSKQSLFTAQERLALVQEAVSQLEGVRVDQLADGLVADYCRQQGAQVMIRGVRNSSDYEYERGIALANQTQYEPLETLLLLARSEYSYLSSSLIKEIAYFDGNISQMVPAHVAQAMIVKNKIK